MTLKIKLTKIEYFEFATIANHYFNISKDLLNSSEYLHFYNLKSIVQTLMKKQIFEVNFNRKTYLLSLTVNEYNSLRHIYFIAEKPNNFTNVVIHNIFTNLDKQILDNNHILICNHNGNKNNIDQIN